MLELFAKQEPRLWVVGEYTCSESHYIMARGPTTELKDIVEIQSHPAILEQCQDFLDATLPEGYRAVLASNTATAAEQVANSDEFGMYVFFFFFPVPFFLYRVIQYGNARSVPFCTHARTHSVMLILLLW